MQRRHKRVRTAAKHIGCRRPEAGHGGEQTPTPATSSFPTAPCLLRSAVLGLLQTNNKTKPNNKEGDTGHHGEEKHSNSSKVVNATQLHLRMWTVEEQQRRRQRHQPLRQPQHGVPQPVGGHQRRRHCLLTTPPQQRPAGTCRRRAWTRRRGTLVCFHAQTGG